LWHSNSSDFWVWKS